MRKTKAAAMLLFIYIISFLFGNISVLAASETEAALSYEAASTEEDAVACDVKISSRIWELLFGKESEVSASNGEKLLLCPGGSVFGAKITRKYITVADAGDNKKVKNGDIILKVNGKSVESIDDVKSAVSSAKGGTVTLTLMRDGAEFTADVTPKLEDGEYKLGLNLSDGAAGIGTITFIDKETGVFGGLGHAICDRDSGEIIEMKDGEATGVVLSGVKKGTCGTPGELTGVLTSEVKGELYKNCECGIFGRLNPEELEGLCEIEVAKKEEITEGKAEIISSVKNGKTARFDIEIHDVDTDATGNKCFKIKVTDSALIALNGGIVRGMSGSPIIQDGKLVGAVTHVMVADPTEGYGIFIENMLNASEVARNELPKAA